MKIDVKIILKLRAEKAWSQEELAKTSGLNLRTIQRIEKSGIASLHSKKVLASALGIDVQDLNYKEMHMTPCPECKSEEVYQYKDYIDSTMMGGELLPKLSSSIFSSAKIRPVVCSNCGFLRYFVSAEALEKLKTSKHWMRV
jgi:DNA-binding XRE family transcriptional regulator